MYYVATVAMLVTMALALIRALLGPTVYDRVLAVNMFGTKTVLLFAVLAFLAGRPDFLDMALAYALINFIGILAVLEFFRSRAARREEEQHHGQHRDNPATAAEPDAGMPARAEQDRGDAG